MSNTEYLQLVGYWYVHLEMSWISNNQSCNPFQDIVKFAANDFISVEKEGTGSRLVSWAGIRHMVTEVTSSHFLTYI